MDTDLVATTPAVDVAVDNPGEVEAKDEEGDDEAFTPSSLPLASSPPTDFLPATVTTPLVCPIPALLPTLFPLPFDNFKPSLAAWTTPPPFFSKTPVDRIKVGVGFDIVQNSRGRKVVSKEKNLV